MEDIESKIKTAVSAAFMKKGSINVRGTEIKLVKLLGITKQIRPNNHETDEYIINFNGRVYDAENDGFSENNYNCIVSAIITESACVESINVIYVI